MRAPRVGTVKKFRPVLFDRCNRNTAEVEPGSLVRVIQPHGCPRNGTMGMCYIEHESGEFIGLCCINSLVNKNTLPYETVWTNRKEA